ncbi:MAG TPA: sigma-70 family RNA polymerase sigma factor [Pyrinomonadaceae bacterium]|nr:sigma-70 family RNA polymerase sigma factor [Pyrinomonadaceae bacterium]
MAAPQDPPEPRAAADTRQAELIRGAAGGDQQALAALYDATSRTVYGLLLRILADQGAAEEVLLDVYAQVWRQAADYSAARGSPMAWLTTIARSRAIDRLRRGRQERERAEPLEAFEQVAAMGASVEDDVTARERAGVVRAALSALPAEQREVIELAYYGGLSHSEIAAARGLPLGTVKTRTRLGLTRLRETLKSAYEGMR